ncbi:MAG: S8 family serine peptidase [Oscillospiraceae bacterium]
MKKLLIVFLASLMLFGAAGISALAAPESTAASYIVKLKNDGAVSLFSDGTSKCDSHGLRTISSGTELNRLIESGCVEYCEPNYKVKLFGLSSDEYYSKQWNLKDIGADAAWNAGLNGAGVTVAVIDSGIYAEHEDLLDADILHGKNLINSTDDYSDILGHGTLVSGVLAATRDNGKGIAGISDAISIVPLKCFANIDEAAVMDITRGIYMAVDDYHCSVICMSFGASDDSRTLRDAVNYAASKGVILVAAVGNEGTEQLFYPAAYDKVIGVGAYGQNGDVSGFSQKNESVFVSAPGVDIVTTGIGVPDSYSRVAGTSFSAPHVAAMAAVAKSVTPTMDVNTFKSLLISTSRDAGKPGYDTDFGYGKIDMSSFVSALLGGAPVGIQLFSDVGNHWARDYIEYCFNAKLFSGVSATRFDPDGLTTRGMLVTVLDRYDAGLHPVGAEALSFSDVADTTAWYFAPVRWAASNGFVKGYEDGTFHPSEPVTREQLCSILYRYSGSPEVQDAGVLKIFDDFAEVSDYALNAVAWCYLNGIVGGSSNSTLTPKNYATRAQMAAIISRYAAYTVK